MSRCTTNSPECYARAHDPRQCSCPPRPRRSKSKPSLFVVFNGDEPMSFTMNAGASKRVAEKWSKGSVVEYGPIGKVK
jgi:hypothetical protein